MGDNVMSMQDAVRQDGLLLRWATLDVKANREVALSAVKQNGRALRYVVEELKHDREVVLMAMRNDATFLRYAAPGLKKQICYENRQQLRGDIRWLDEE